MGNIHWDEITDKLHDNVKHSTKYANHSKIRVKYSMKWCKTFHEMWKAFHEMVQNILQNV